MAGGGTAHLRVDEDLALRVEHLVVEHRTNTGAKLHAVSDVSLDVRRQETLSLVGESGCGKSTTARAIVMLDPPTSGSIRFQDQDLTKIKARRLRGTRTKLQMIFQDPVSSLNPRRRVHDILLEGPAVWGKARSRRARVAEMLSKVGLDPAAVGDRRPHELSGGQCQRVAVARALMVEPEVLVCDEPVSALDVSVQAQILNLLEDLKQGYGLTIVFIAHDLAVVKNTSDRTAVMYMGKLCEVGASEEVYRDPRHPYTLALLAAVPEPEPDRVQSPVRLAGEPPSPMSPPAGCRFRARCPRAQRRCAAEEPLMREVGTDHFVACHFPEPES